VPRWWYKSRTRAINAQVLKTGTVVWSRAYGDGYGRDPRQAQEVHTLAGRLVRLIRTKGAIDDPHELLEEPNGHIFLESYVEAAPVDLRAHGGPQRGGIVFPRLQEQTAKGRVIRTLNLRSELTTDETNERWWDPILRNPRPGKKGIRVFDVIHVNSIEPWGKKLVVSTRHTDAVYGLNRHTGKILWKLGGKTTSKSLTPVNDPIPPNQLFGGQHDARIWGKDILSIFDNSQDRPRKPRGVLYRLDLRAHTATFLGQLIDPKADRGNCCGSVRAIRGGWLVGFGDTTLVTGFTKKGKVAFRLNWGNSYRAMPVKPGRVSLRALDRGLEQMERG
jgi:outer membrane protein assembly factor BamB